MLVMHTQGGYPGEGKADPHATPRGTRKRPLGTRLAGAVREGGRLALPVVLVLPVSMAGAGAPGGDDLTGRVVDPSGKGVAAHVWVIGEPRNQPEVVTETSANDQGAFHLPGFWTDQASGTSTAPRVC